LRRRKRYFHLIDLRDHLRELRRCGPIVKGNEKESTFRLLNFASRVERNWATARDRVLS
jgi:hypothetical protein